MSDTSKTEARRRRKKAAQGKDRKKKRENEGSTPKFPIDPSKEESEPRSVQGV